MFADISGFTALSGKMDPEDLADTMNACFELIERIIVERDGKVEQYIGDSAMALFQSVDGPAQALNAAIAIRGQVRGLIKDRKLPGRLGVHIGVHTGSGPIVSAGAPTNEGHATLWSIATVAAGLQDAAGESVIYTSGATLAETRERFAFEQRRPLTLKTVRETVVPYELVSSAEVSPRLIEPRAAPAQQDSGDTTVSDRRKTTVVFANVLGFDELGLAMEPASFTETMSDCFARIASVVVERGGTVDKVVLSCTMALFGAPRALEHAARQAINAAIEIRNVVERFNVERALPARLEVQIGINTGLVFAGEIGGGDSRDYTVLGSTVNLASRLQNAAGRGHIYVGKATHRQTAADFEFVELAPRRLKGIRTPVVAYDVTAREESVHRARLRSDAAGRRSPIVGREREVETLARTLEAVTAGTGGVVSVVGENGLGKSRLLAEVLETRLRVLTVEGRSLSIGGTLRFHPFVDLLRNWAKIPEGAEDETSSALLSRAVTGVCEGETDEILPFLATLMGLPLGDANATRIRAIEGDALERLIRKAMRRLFERISQTQSLVLVFEDLHWADLSSIALLESVLPLAATEPIVFLLVARPDYEATSERVLRYAAENLSAVHTRMRLAPLGAAQCDVLIDDFLGSDTLPAKTRTLIKRNTEGNPFYIEEILRTLVEQGAFVNERGRLVATSRLDSIEIPGTVEEVIMARVDLLESAPRELLQIASVGGRRFFYRLLREAASDAAELDAALELLIAKQFLFRAGLSQDGPPATRAAAADTTYVFKHALIQESVYNSLLKKRRVELHARFAHAIEALYPDRLDDFYGMLAYHYTRADSLEQAEHYLFKAGEEAADAAAPAEALQYFQEAYRVYLTLYGDDADAHKKAQLEKNIAQALLNVGNLQESIEHFNSAIELCGESVPKTPVALYVKALRDLPVVLWHLYTSSRRRTQPPQPSEQVMFASLYNRCRAQNPTDPERNFFDNIAAMRYLSRVDPSTVDRAVGMYASTGAFFAFAGLSFTVGRRFLHVAEELLSPERPADRFQHAAMASVVDFHAGDWDGAHDMDDELLEEGMRAGLLWDADVYLGMVCERDIRKGRFADASRILVRLSELSQGYGYEFARSNWLAMTAFELLEQRRLDEARRAMQAYYDFRHEDTLRLLALSGLIKIETLDGRLDAAQDAMRRADIIVARSGRLAPFYVGAYWTSRLACTLARWEQTGEVAPRDEAQRCAQRAVATSARICRERPEALRLAARLEWQRGKRTRAIKTWRHAIAEANRMGARPELGRICMDVGRHLSERGDTTTTIDGLNARAWLQRAQEVFSELELAWDLERAEAPIVSHERSGLRKVFGRVS